MLQLHLTGILGCCKCNHDVAILLRAPVPTATDEAHSSLAASMAASARSASYYITAYITKTHPHLSNLWLLLRSGHERLQSELHQHPQREDARYVAARVLTRMLTSAEKNTHKSMAEICHYLLGFPEAYVTHSFKKLYVTNLVHRALQLRPVATLTAEEPESSFYLYRSPPDTTVGDDTDMHPVCLISGHQELDYMYRGPDLSTWPLYFYVAAIQRCSAQRLPPSSVYTYFEPQHPYAARSVQRLRLDTAWSIPALCGIALPPPDQDLELHSLILLLLFKPWARVDLLDLLQDPETDTQFDSWASALAHYRSCLLCTISSTSSSQSRPVPFTPLYWAQRVLVAFCGLCYCFQFFCRHVLWTVGCLRSMDTVAAVLTPHGLHLPTPRPPGREWRDDVASAADLPLSESEDTLDASDTDVDDAEMVRSLTMFLTTERSFHLSWPALRAAVHNPTLDSRNPAQTKFAREFFSSLSTMCAPPGIQACGATCLRSIAPAAFAQLQKEARAGFAQEDVDSDDLPTFALPSLPPLPSVRKSATVFQFLEDYILAGHCNTREGTLNHKQALFLVVFSLALHVSWLQTRLPACFLRSLSHASGTAPCC